MKSKILITLAMTLIIGGLAGCKSNQNPLLTDFNTPFGAPPFDKIENKHYLPAFEQAIKEARQEIEAIIKNTEAPTFENTIEAMEHSGERLGTISSIFFNLNYAETNDEMQAIALQVSPMLTEYSNDISLNPELFARVKAVYDARETLNLNPEQARLLEKSYKGFARNGASLSEEDKQKYRTITSELSDISLKFDQNILSATNAFTIHITDSTQLSGLPQFAIAGFAEEAKSRNLEGWVITLQAPSLIPFLTYSDNRELKKQLWTASNTKCVGGEFDNVDNVKRIANLRLELANLLGYPTYADYVLEERMAESSDNVTNFLVELETKGLPYAKQDFETVSQYAKTKGADFQLMPWDWAYFSEKYKSEIYAVNDEMTKPFFKLENVEKGIFTLANKLYGLTFKLNKEIPVYQKDVKVYEVYDENNRFMSLLYMDYFPRASKKGGAWMTSFREQSIKNGEESRPLITVVCNFTKPTENEPSLLTFDEVTTTLHEFGHALHGILAEGTYASLTGTSVFRDFVELPSQIMENWALEKEFLDLFAEHYQTGEKIPAELVEKLVAANNFLSGYTMIRQVSFSVNDMAWHSIKEPFTGDPVAFERNAIAACQIMPVIEGTAMAPSFSHIFSGGYSAGYYSYKWAEVLEADAFSLFKEKGIFNREVSYAFRDNILSQGGMKHPMELFVNFRGHEPSVDALFKKSGLN